KECEPELACEVMRVRRQNECAWKQVRRRRHVSALPGPDPRAPEVLSAPDGELLRAVVAEIELGDVAVRLLEVIADDFVGRIAPLESAGRTLVQVGAVGLRDAAVGDVAYENVVEDENVLARVDQPSLGQ